MVIDSNQKKLNSLAIIKIAAENTKADRPLKQVIELLTVEYSNPKVWKMQQGNTIFIVHRTKIAGKGFFRALNADSPRMLIQNSQVFMRAAYKAGFDVLVTQFTEPSLMNIFRVIGKAQPEGMGYGMQRTDDNGFQVTLRLGPSRSGEE